MSIHTDTIALEMCLEEEKKKCLKNLQNYYKKYGCEPIHKLRDYLQSTLEILSEDQRDERNEIKKQLELLDLYS